MPHVAVIDIGKTNKKIAIYNEALEQVAFASETFAAGPDDNGVFSEPVEAMWAWFTAGLKDLYAQQPFDAISITTHGGTVAALNAQGELALPQIAYDTPLSDDEQTELDQAFYDLVGRLEDVQAETATCDLPLLINPAKMLFWAKRRFPDAFASIAQLVNYPQYWGYRLTGQLAAEATYTANHAFLFDPRHRRPSSVARKLEVADAVDCELLSPWAPLGTLTDPLQAELGLPALPVTVGIHDSNAALLPYLVKHAGRDFVLNSTGTWCVGMHRVDGIRYAPEELGQKIIFNIDALDGFQKVAFLMGGQDYDLYHTLIGGEDPGFDAERVDAALADTQAMVLPGHFPSQFPGLRGGATDGKTTCSVEQLQAGERPACFADPVRAHDLLNVSLALQSQVALQRTGISDGTAVFVEGGFRNNPTYLAVLAALFQPASVSCTTLAQATATGAALLGFALLEQTSPVALADRVTIEESPVAAPSLPHLAAYRDAFLARVQA